MYKIAKSLLFQLDPERAHHLVIHQMAKYPNLVRVVAPSWTPSPMLRTKCLSMTFDHPIGLAAGLDKDAVAIPGLFACGFSFVEVGTVTPVPQSGNPTPRLFRLIPDEALINRMGFNNQGASACRRQIEALSTRSGVIGVNIGKNKVTQNERANEDYAKALSEVLPCADYITINLSSPNTPGLRDLQSSQSILDLLSFLQPIWEENPKPIFVKVAPDLADESVRDISQALLTSSFRNHIGLIATNTTLSRDHLQSEAARETGGLSGRPLAARSTEVIRQIWLATDGRIPIIGCGGIFDADDAYEKIRAGASLLQIYTSFIYRGPKVVQDIARGLTMLLERDGYASVQDAIGADYT